VRQGGWAAQACTKHYKGWFLGGRRGRCVWFAFEHVQKKGCFPRFFNRNGCQRVNVSGPISAKTGGPPKKTKSYASRSRKRNRILHRQTRTFPHRSATARCFPKRCPPSTRWRASRRPAVRARLLSVFPLTGFPSAARVVVRVLPRLREG
jgi:hypothetical protein